MTTHRDVSAFKTYDIRGIFPEQVNAPFMDALARAFATRFRPQSIVIGYDSRLSSKELAAALSQGFLDSGVDVLDLGLCGTEMVYFATGTYKADGGIMITASHNPKDYNGCKIVARDVVPVGAGNGLLELKKMVAENGPFQHTRPAQPGYHGDYTRLDVTKEFLGWMTAQLYTPINSDLRVVLNAGNGAAGPTLRTLAGLLPCRCDLLFEKPDGNFPNGVPNPLLPECREDTSRAVLETGADLGVAFDGDFDRCFFFDEKGRFIEGYYIVGLLARQILKKQPGAKIIHDPRLTWNTIETVKEMGGIPVESKTGHAFIKERMRLEKAEYGGEMSAHHYFRSFWYCDTGILPLLLILELLSSTGRRLSELVDEAIRRFPVTGEQNFTISASPDQVLRAVEDHFGGKGTISRRDGLSISFDHWRFNLRASNTEPLLRLNVESREDAGLLREKRDELVSIITGFK
jgi:phosphomannomutase